MNWHSLIHPAYGLCRDVLPQVELYKERRSPPNIMDPLYRVLLQQLLKGIAERKITYGQDAVMMAILTIAQDSVEAKLNA